MLFFAAAIFAFVPWLTAQELDGDSNIYASVIASLQELKVRQMAEDLGVEYGEVPKPEPTSVCYDDLGCFNRNGTFKHLKQLPDTPENVATQFVLYTRKNFYNPQIIDYKKPQTVLKSNLNPSNPLKFITHGFGGKNNLTWIWNMKNAFLQKEDVNIIVVDWSLGAKVPYYINAAVNAELVGAQVAALYYFIKDNMGIKEKDLHVVGFSLGAQVSGFVGKRMKKLRGTRPARITGLDPASPLFEDYGGDVHLWKDDGDLVEIVHTNADLLIYGGVGMELPIGHVDYYPNGGKRQPGCGSTLKGAFLDLLNKGERMRTCNHERAVHLFTESILNPTACQFVSYPCPDYSKFESGDCLSCKDKSCGIMGYKGRGIGTYFFKTKEAVPFCADNVKLTVQFSKENKKSYGKIVLILEGKDNYKENITITEKDEKLKPGMSKVTTIALSQKVQKMNEITVIYNRYDGWFSKGTETFTLGRIIIENAEGKKVFSYCGEDKILQDNTAVRVPLTGVKC